MAVNLTLGAFQCVYEVSDEMYTKEAWDDLLQNWLTVLVEENEQLKEEATPKGLLVATEAAEFALSVSSKLQLSANIRFLALDIYNRFCAIHINLVTKQLKVDYPKENFEEYLKKSQEKVALQAPLRIITCLRIASKIICHKKIMTSESIQNVLKEIGLEFSLQSINKSEMRVLETLNFRCTFASPMIDYICVLIGCVRKEAKERQSSPNNFFINQSEKIRETTLLLLDATILRSDAVYQELLFRVTGSRSLPNEHRDAFYKVVNDRLLLAASMLMAGGWVVEGDRLSQMVLKIVAKAALLPQGDVEMFSSCIIKIVVQK